MNTINFSADASKESVFEQVSAHVQELGLAVATTDITRPWGGFFVFEESEADRFIELYFPHLTKADLMIGDKLSPKFLLVAPNQRLSWQYHYRRAEIWKCIGGVAGVVTSDTDEEKQQHTLAIGDIIQLKQGERHRLVGLDGWGLIAEIWQHTDASQPSNEDDIVRLQDDYGRGH